MRREREIDVQVRRHLLREQHVLHGGREKPDFGPESAIDLLDHRLRDRHQTYGEREPRQNRFIWQNCSAIANADGFTKDSQLFCDDLGTDEL